MTASNRLKAENEVLRSDSERLREALRRAVDLLDDLELGLSERQASIVEQVRSAITNKDDKP